MKRQLDETDHESSLSPSPKLSASPSSSPTPSCSSPTPSSKERQEESNRSRCLKWCANNIRPKTTEQILCNPSVVDLVMKAVPKGDLGRQLRLATVSRQFGRSYNANQILIIRNNERVTGHDVPPKWWIDDDGDVFGDDDSDDDSDDNDYDDDEGEESGDDDDEQQNHHAAADDNEIADDNNDQQPAENDTQAGERKRYPPRFYIPKQRDALYNIPSFGIIDQAAFDRFDGLRRVRIIETAWTMDAPTTFNLLAARASRRLHTVEINGDYRNVNSTAADGNDDNGDFINDEKSSLESTKTKKWPMENLKVIKFNEFQDFERLMSLLRRIRNPHAVQVLQMDEADDADNPLNERSQNFRTHAKTLSTFDGLLKCKNMPGIFLTGGLLNDGFWRGPLRHLDISNADVTQLNFGTVLALPELRTLRADIITDIDSFQRNLEKMPNLTGLQLNVSPGFQPALSHLRFLTRLDVKFMRFAPFDNMESALTTFNQLVLNDPGVLPRLESLKLTILVYAGELSGVIPFPISPSRRSLKHLSVEVFKHFHRDHRNPLFVLRLSVSQNNQLECVRFTGHLEHLSVQLLTNIAEKAVDAEISCTKPDFMMNNSSFDHIIVVPSAENPPAASPPKTLSLYDADSAAALRPIFSLAAAKNLIRIEHRETYVCE